MRGDGFELGRMKLTLEQLDLSDSYPPPLLWGFWNVVFQEGVRGNHFLFDAVKPSGFSHNIELDLNWAKLLACESMSEARNHLQAQSEQSYSDIQKIYYVWLESSRSELKWSLS